MQKRIWPYSDEMLLAIALWLCVLPLIGWLALPAWGIEAAILLALAILAVIVLLCWGACGWYLPRQK